MVPRVSPGLDRRALLSALLIWDRVLVPAPNPLGALHDSALELMEQLEEHGASAFVELPEVGASTPEEIVAAVDHAAKMSNVPRDVNGMFTLGALTAIAVVADDHGRRIRASLDACTDLHAAPLTSGRISFMASSLPAEVANGHVNAGRLICAAVSSVAVDPRTDLEVILRFREQNAALRGRFRAALGDLAGSLSHDAPGTVGLEEARAIVANRVTPAVADLERALTERRMTYVWRTLMAGATVAASPIAPGITTSGAATFVTHSLAYAFNRRRLVAEHPYGFLREARLAFPSDDGPGILRAQGTITDPAHEIRQLWLEAMSRALPRPGLHEIGEEGGQLRQELHASVADALRQGFRRLDTDV